MNLHSMKLEIASLKDGVLVYLLYVSFWMQSSELKISFSGKFIISKQYELRIRPQKFVRTGKKYES